MSKINGDKARQNLRDRKSSKMRERMRALRQAAQQVREKTAAKKAS
jgi:hypothetical protein